MKVIELSSLANVGKLKNHEKLFNREPPTQSHFYERS